MNLSEYRDPWPMHFRIFRLIWMLIWGALSFFPNIQPIRLMRLFILKCFGAEVSWTSNVYNSVKIYNPRNLSLGEYSTLGRRVNLYNVDKVLIGDNVVISQDSQLLTASHDISSYSFKLVTKPIIVQDRVWIASNVIVLPGVLLAVDSVAAAGTVVHKSVDSNSVVAGNPARIIRKRKYDETSF